MVDSILQDVTVKIVGKESGEQLKREKLMSDKTENITLYLYYMGDFKMKYENLTREKADEILDYWNGVEHPGWFAQEMKRQTK